MCSLSEIELFRGHYTHEKSILKALPMNKCLKAELYHKPLARNASVSAPGSTSPSPIQFNDCKQTVRKRLPFLFCEDFELLNVLVQKAPT